MAINHGSVVAGDGCDPLTGEPLRLTAGGIPRFKPLPLPAAEGLILTKSQAEAVYDAMCALNNVSHTYLRTNFEAPHGKRISVSETVEGIAVRLHAYQGNPVEQIDGSEDYDTQSAFATAYGLQQG